jgi:hypothetical protein
LQALQQPAAASCGVWRAVSACSAPCEKSRRLCTLGRGDEVTRGQSAEPEPEPTPAAELPEPELQPDDGGLPVCGGAERFSS